MKYEMLNEKYKKELDAYDRILQENSTEDAMKTLKAIIGSLEKNKDPNKETKEMLTMGKGIMDYYNKNKSFSPDQAKWIANVSKSMFK